MVGVGEYENYHGHFSAFDIAREIYGQMYLNIFSIHNTFLRKNQAVENYEVAKLLKNVLTWRIEVTLLILTLNSMYDDLKRTRRIYNIMKKPRYNKPWKNDR